MAKNLIIVNDANEILCVDTDTGTITNLGKNEIFAAAQTTNVGDDSIAPVDQATASKVGCPSAVAAVIMVNLKNNSPA